MDITKDKMNPNKQWCLRATFVSENKRLRYEQVLHLLCHMAECSTTQIECTADSVNMKHPALLFTLVQQHRVEMVNP